ncbi:uncharacterized protein [Halyomorpha halys]|uniref:uncharacterized protein n=1 Tax=Halyomorpha halys TaxID=286706 RepID=UPI0034D33608
MLEKGREYGIKTHHLLVDFKHHLTAFIGQLYKAMREFNIPQKLIRMREVRCMVQIGGARSDEFVSGTERRQEYALACILFDLALEKAIRESGIQVSRTIFSRTIQLLAYADDIDIAGRSFQAVPDGFMKLAEAARKKRLEENAEKTKFMVTEEIPRPGEEIRIGEYTFGKVPEFVYLGSLITQDNVVDSEIKRRANRCCYGLSSYFRSRALSKDSKFYLI